MSRSPSLAVPRWRAIRDSDRPLGKEARARLHDLAERRREKRDNERRTVSLTVKAARPRRETSREAARAARSMGRNQLAERGGDKTGVGEGVEAVAGEEGQHRVKRQQATLVLDVVPHERRAALQLLRGCAPQRVPSLRVPSPRRSLPGPCHHPVQESQHAATRDTCRRVPSRHSRRGCDLILPRQAGGCTQRQGSRGRPTGLLGQGGGGFETRISQDRRPIVTHVSSPSRHSQDNKGPRRRSRASAGPV